MKEFKSSIFDSIVSKGLRNAMLLFILYLTNSLIDYSALVPFQIGFWGIIITYVFISFIQIFYTNNDLKIEGDEIVVQSSLLPGLRKKRFNKNEIRSIIFKDEWSETLMDKGLFGRLFFTFFLMWFIPWEYKWIKIETKNNQKFKYYFFGLNYEFHDNSEEVLFEDMFLQLASSNIKVKWKSTKDSYFRGIQKTADEILLKLNKQKL